MIRKLVLLVAAAVVLCVASPAAHATDAGYVFYEKKHAEILKTAGAKVWETADDARKASFFQFAIEQAERAIDYDRDQRDARDFLKYTKNKDGKWVQDAEAFNAVAFRKQNTRSTTKEGQQESQESFDKRIKKWEEESLAKTNKFVAARYAELGEICAANGFKEQANKGFESALRFDKDNAKARKALGYTKLGKVWLNKKQEEARKAAAKADVVKTPEKNGWEDIIGVKLNKVESLHVRIESPYDVDELKGHCEAAEAAYAYYLSDFGILPGDDVFDNQKALFIVMSENDQWNKFVDRFGGNDKEFTRQLSGCGAGELCHGIRSGPPETKNADGGVTRHSGGTPAGRRDHIIHSLTHELNRAVWRLAEKPWLNEGLAYFYTIKVLESCGTFCVARKKGDYANGNKDEGGLKDWGQTDNWKPLMKELVQKKNDLPLRQIMNQPITTLQFDASVKAWSVAQYLMDLDRDKFIGFLTRLKDPSVKQDLELQNTYDKGVEDIEKDWVAYVIRCY